MNSDPSGSITFSAPIHPVTILARPHVVHLPNGHELVLPTGTTLREGSDARFSPGWLRDVTLKAFEGLLNDLPTDPDELRKAFLESLLAVERTIFPLLYVSHGTPLTPAPNGVPRDLLYNIMKVPEGYVSGATEAFIEAIEVTKKVSVASNATAETMRKAILKALHDHSTLPDENDPYLTVEDEPMEPVPESERVPVVKLIPVEPTSQETSEGFADGPGFHGIATIRVNVYPETYFSRLISSMRRKNNITLGTFAKRLGISVSDASKLERGGYDLSKEDREIAYNAARSV